MWRCSADCSVPPLGMVSFAFTGHLVSVSPIRSKGASKLTKAPSSSVIETTCSRIPPRTPLSTAVIRRRTVSFPSVFPSSDWINSDHLCTSCGGTSREDYRQSMGVVRPVCCRAADHFDRRRDRIRNDAGAVKPNRYLMGRFFVCRATLVLIKRNVCGDLPETVSTS